jgi:hypothetical protein
MSTNVPARIDSRRREIVMVPHSWHRRGDSGRYAPSTALAATSCGVSIPSVKVA